MVVHHSQGDRIAATKCEATQCSINRRLKSLPRIRFLLYMKFWTLQLISFYKSKCIKATTISNLVLRKGGTTPAATHPHKTWWLSYGKIWIRLKQDSNFSPVVHSIPYKGNGKGKVVPVLFLNRAPRHESVLGECGYSSTHSLTSALYGGEWSTSRSGRFTPRENVPGTHWSGGWMGPRAVLDAVVKRKFPASAGNRNLERRSSSL
jgi:hypothetical protein